MSHRTETKLSTLRDAKLAQEVRKLRLRADREEKASLETVKLQRLGAYLIENGSKILDNRMEQWAIAVTTLIVADARGLGRRIEDLIRADLNALGEAFEDL